jgi:uncharacterized Zn finger protein
MKGHRMNSSNNIDLQNAVSVVCESCAGRTFREVALIKKISALLSPSGKEIVVPVATFACTNCGHINKDFDPDAKGVIK